MMAAEMVVARPDGTQRSVARVTAWLLGVSDTSDAATDRYPPLVEGEAVPVPHSWVGAPGYLDAVSWRRQRTVEGEAAVVWLSPLDHVVDSEETTALQRLALVADCANGAGAVLDPQSFLL